MRGALYYALEMAGAGTLQSVSSGGGVSVIVP